MERRVILGKVTMRARSESLSEVEYDGLLDAVRTAIAPSPEEKIFRTDSRRSLERRGANMCLLGRWADAREVAYPILWLASDGASCVTGAVLMVDGDNGRRTKAST